MDALKNFLSQRVSTYLLLVISFKCFSKA